LPEREREVLDFDQIKPYEGIPNCLKELKQHFKLAMVSGSNRNTVETIVDQQFPFYPKTHAIDGALNLIFVNNIYLSG